jgi:hypothetical protein
LDIGFQGEDDGEADWKVAFTRELKKVEWGRKMEGKKTRSNDGIIFVREAKSKCSGR